MERRFEGSTAQSIIRFLEQKDTGGYGRFSPLREKFPAEGGGKGQRVAYQIQVPWGRIRTFFNGIGDEQEPVIAVNWPTGELDVVASSKAIEFMLRNRRA